MRKLLIFSLLLIHCKSTPESSEDPNDPKIEPTAQVESKNEPASAPTSNRGFMVFDGVPEPEEHKVLKLSWIESGQTQLRSVCEENEPSGKTIDIKAGDTIDFAGAVTHVTSGTTVSAKTAHTTNVSPIGKDGEFQPSIELNIAKGTQVEIMKYEGEGTCVIKIENMIANANCPGTDRYQADGWLGDVENEFYWCVPHKGDPANGWIRVDDNVQVEEKSG